MILHQFKYVIYVKAKDMLCPNALNNRKKDNKCLYFVIIKKEKGKITNQPFEAIFWSGVPPISITFLRGAIIILPTINFHYYSVMFFFPDS